MTLKDALQWAVILSILSIPLGWVALQVLRGQSREEALAAAFAKEGLTAVTPAPPGTDWALDGRSPRGPYRVQRAVVKQGVKQRRLTVSRELPARPEERLLAGPAMPGWAGDAAPLAAKLFGVDLPPKAEVPGALAGRYDLFATEGTAARLLTSEAQAALLAWPGTFAEPVLELQAGRLFVRLKGEDAEDEEPEPTPAQVRAAVALLDAFTPAT